MNSDDRAKIPPRLVKMIGLNEPEAEELFGERSKEVRAAMEKADVWRAVQTLAEQIALHWPYAGRHLLFLSFKMH